MNILKAIVNKVNDEYVFKISNFNDEYEIYYSINNNMEGKSLLVKGYDEEIKVKSPTDNTRVFFEVINAGRSTGAFSTRLVDVSSIENFRDLGGYVTEDGRRVRWGCFYRCANMGKVNERDKNYLENMGLATIFDLRSEMEVATEADVKLKNCKYINESGIKDMENSIGSKDNFDMISVLKEMLRNTEKMNDIESFLVSGYRTMVEKNEAFKIFFDNIKQEERLPLVFHCTAGKDRTGVAGALLLLALGVSEKRVVEDYTLSNVYRKESNELQFAKIRNFIKDENVLEAIKWMFEVKEDYIMVTLNEIKKKYSSYEEYIINELGVTRNELNKLKENYLF